MVNIRTPCCLSRKEHKGCVRELRNKKYNGDHGIRLTCSSGMGCNLNKADVISAEFHQDSEQVILESKKGETYHGERCSTVRART
jgi:hypothetical protein